MVVRDCDLNGVNIGHSTSIKKLKYEKPQMTGLDLSDVVKGGVGPFPETTGDASGG